MKIVIRFWGYNIHDEVIKDALMNGVKPQTPIIQPGENATFGGTTTTSYKPTGFGGKQYGNASATAKYPEK